MAAFSDTSFDQSAFDPDAFAFGTYVAPAFAVVTSSGDIRQKKKKKEYAQWNAMIWPKNVPHVPPAQPETPLAEAGPAIGADIAIPARPVLVSARMRQALSGKIAMRPGAILDAETQRKIAAMKLRLRQEIEDEEALLLLGAFD